MIDTTENPQQQEVVTKDKMDQIAGRGYVDDDQSVEQEDSLVSKQSMLSSERSKKATDNTGYRIMSAVTVGSIFGVALMLLFSFYGKISGGEDVAEEKSKGEDVTLSKSTDNDSLKADVATGQQEADLKPVLVSTTLEPKETEPKEAEPEPVRTSPEPRPQVEEKEITDPLDDWAILANQGTAVGNKDLAIANLNNNGSNNTSAASKGSSTRTFLPSATVRNKVDIEDTVARTPLSTSTNSTAEESAFIQDDSLDRSINKGEVTKVASVSIGKDTIEQSQTDVSSSSKFDENNPAVVRLLSEKPKTEAKGYLERKREQFAAEDRLAKLSASGASGTSSVSESSSAILVSYNPDLDLQDSTIGIGENSLVEPQYVAASSAVDAVDAQVKDVALGSTFEGEISSSIIWSEGISPSQSRGKINLSEPILATDGSVALPENSTLVVEVDSIASNGLTSLSVIAVSYEDKEGRLKQEILPDDAIVIRGEDAAPLIAQQTEDSGGTVLGQDILIGALSAGARGFEVLNEPDDSTTISDDLVVRNTRNRNNSLINGAAEGIFSTTQERLEDRSDRIIEEELATTPIYHLETGKTVTVIVNSFLEIEL
jgi:hypothetical protein